MHLLNYQTFGQQEFEAIVCIDILSIDYTEMIDLELLIIFRDWIIFPSCQKSSRSLFTHGRRHVATSAGMCASVCVSMLGSLM